MGSAASIIGPLYADLDGTIVRSDTLWESLVLIAKRDPLAFFALAGRLGAGKAAFKRAVAGKAVPDPATLPYDRDVADFLSARRAAGQEIILATAADAAVASAVAAHLGIFSAVLASDGRVNNAGAAKRDAVVAHAAGRPFEYLGDGHNDEEVRRAAAVAHVVGRQASEKPSTGRGTGFIRPRLAPRPLFAALRAKQWAKNLLVFVPAALSHRIGEPRLLAASFAAFASFSLCASAVYVVNDLWDIDADRGHPVKRLRPFARGDMRIPDGLLAAAASLLLGFAVAAAFLPPAFAAMLAGYVLVTSLYTFGLKRFVVVDVLIVAACYVWRVAAGSAATGVRPSGWLIVFSVFFFLSLAFLKRFAELAMRRVQGLPAEAGRGYAAADMDVIRLLGVASGTIAVFVMALYVTNPQVTVLYRQPPLLWTVVLATLYWIARAWILAGRGAIKDDPFAFTVGDRASYATAALMAAVLVLAS
ncbi:MAG TPA: UbiA family prenyltransferase [Patescibacteria group bacterium]|nr:UbiA family prenyltransferase [Patescibacteria group bacterium]